MKLITPLLIISLLALVQGCSTQALREFNQTKKNIEAANQNVREVQARFIAENPEYVALRVRYLGKNVTTLTQKMNPEFLTEEEKVIVLKGYDNWVMCCPGKLIDDYVSKLPSPFGMQVAQVAHALNKKREKLVMAALAGKITIGEWATQRALTDEEFQEHLRIVDSRYRQGIDKRHNAEVAERSRTFSENFQRSLDRQAQVEAAAASNNNNDDNGYQIPPIQTCSLNSSLNNVICY